MSGQVDISRGGTGTGAGDRIATAIVMYKDHEDRVSEAESAAPTEGSSPVVAEKDHATTASDEDDRRAYSVDGASQTFIPPNGGLEAWLLVLAGFLVFSNTWWVVSH